MVGRAGFREADAQALPGRARAGRPRSVRVNG